ncbi:late competence development ComFB family protein [Halanaerobium hydrogeniformans]|uniref:Late competence development protein ComFB n=1 Tax=Halanaerobium hydrogeniformans TaxID=656519 RepID=E4RNZ0_HALHG|nr:late competence development ComFB family protein [Halanaerobium hydrogeniformans]ADQ13680.1 Late competence development protein ComFB [Halanaerobium hydrogeniformans]
MLDDKKINKLKSRLHNHTEDIVMQTLKDLLKREEFSNVSDSEEALLDMATYALNRLAPKYVATEKGEVYTKTEELEQQHSVDILSVVTKAIKVVSEDQNNN